MNKPDQYKLGKTVWKFGFIDSQGNECFLMIPNKGYVIFRKDLLDMGAVEDKPEQDEELEEIFKLPIDPGLEDLQDKIEDIIFTVNQLVRVVNQLKNKKG